MAMEIEVENRRPMTDRYIVAAPGEEAVFVGPVDMKRYNNFRAVIKEWEIMEELDLRDALGEEFDEEPGHEGID